MENESSDIKKVFQVGSLVNLETRKNKIQYFFISLVVVLALRMLENTIHELSHGLVVVLVGGKLAENPFLITPFGGYTRWENVPSAMLPLVNIAGTLVSVLFMIGVFLPVYLKRASRPILGWIAYWGAFVIPVNSLFYWFMAPIVGSNLSFDPIAFAAHVGIKPQWVLGLISSLPFTITVITMCKGTRTVEKELMTDPMQFHLYCLTLYYIISIAFPVISYTGSLDTLMWW